MEQVAIAGLDAISATLNALTRLIDLYPWVGQAIPFLPVLPALMQRSLTGIILSAALAFAALVVFFTSSRNVGWALWGAAWVVSIMLGRAKREKRRLKRLIQPVPA